MSTNYEKFIVANQALMDCYKGVPAESFSAMSLAQQSEVCKVEKDAVKAHISSGHVSFANILKERLAELDKE